MTEWEEDSWIIIESKLESRAPPRLLVVEHDEGEAVTLSAYEPRATSLDGYQLRAQEAYKLPVVEPFQNENVELVEGLVLGTELPTYVRTSDADIKVARPDQAVAFQVIDTLCDYLIAKHSESLETVLTPHVRQRWRNSGYLSLPKILLGHRINKISNNLFLHTVAKKALRHLDPEALHRIEYLWKLHRKYSVHCGGALYPTRGMALEWIQNNVRQEERVWMMILVEECEWTADA